MAERFAPTNAASSSVQVDSKVIRLLHRRKNTPELIFLAQWGHRPYLERFAGLIDDG
ncbi:MAG: hypothetical protein OR999_08065 [Arenicellales bacterium]|jgi:hypothetical protein|nr:hypothetical protein [Arenicellales bacterium]